MAPVVGRSSRSFSFPENCHQRDGILVNCIVGCHAVQVHKVKWHTVVTRRRPAATKCRAMIANQQFTPSRSLLNVRFHGIRCSGTDLASWHWHDVWIVKLRGRIKMNITGALILLAVLVAVVWTISGLVARPRSVLTGVVASGIAVLGAGLARYAWLESQSTAWTVAYVVLLLIAVASALRQFVGKRSAVT